MAFDSKNRKDVSIMRRILFLLILLPLVSVFSQSTGEVNPHTVNESVRFNQGEQLEFDLGYGWFTLGKADMKISDQIEIYADLPCYKVDITGRTTGFLGAVSKVDDSWGGYVDVATGLPLYAYADLHEGKYQRKEEIVYDHEEGQLTLDKIKKHKERPTKYFPIEGDLYDLISGYLKLRNLNYNNLNKGDTLQFKAFYDEIYYDFGVLYEGIEIVKTPVGKLRAHRVLPIIPENNIFPGTNPIVAWISADNNQLPLRIEANMWIGHAFVELTDYKNIKFGPDFHN